MNMVKSICEVEEMIPVFVYGTLLSGESNYRIIEPFVQKVTPVQLRNYKMHSIQGHFPAIIKSKKNGVISGELMYLKPPRYQKAIDRLDRLEGYIEQAPECSMYLREKVTVITESGDQVEAYAYIWNRSLKGCPKIPHGNWRTFVNQKWIPLVKW